MVLSRILLIAGGIVALISIAAAVVPFKIKISNAIIIPRALLMIANTLFVLAIYFK